MDRLTADAAQEVLTFQSLALAGWRRVRGGGVQGPGAGAGEGEGGAGGCTAIGVGSTQLSWALSISPLHTGAPYNTVHFVLCKSTASVTVLL